MELIKTAAGALLKHRAKILLGVGIAGVVSTTVLVMKATPKAKELINEAQKDKGEEKLTKFETAKAAAPAYIPAGMCGALSAACIIGSGYIEHTESAALVAACTLSEDKLKDYKEAAKEVLDEKTKKKVDDKATEISVKNHPPVENTVFVTGSGNTLCRESVTGQYFRADIFKVQKILNDLMVHEDDNLRSGYESWLSVGDICFALGLDDDMVACKAAFNNMSNPFKWVAGSCNAPSGEPVYVINYVCDPELGRNI